MLAYDDFGCTYSFYNMHAFPQTSIYTVPHTRVWYLIDMQGVSSGNMQSNEKT